MRIYQLGDLLHLFYAWTHGSCQKMYSWCFCFLFNFPNPFCSHLYCLFLLLPPNTSHSLYFAITALFFLSFTKLLLNPFAPNYFLQFFLLLLLTYYRFSLVFMKRPNKTSCFYKNCSFYCWLEWEMYVETVVCFKEL